MGTTLFAYSHSPINNRMRFSPACGHAYLKGFDMIIASWNCGRFLFFLNLYAENFSRDSRCLCALTGFFPDFLADWQNCRNFATQLINITILILR